LISRRAESTAWRRAGAPRLSKKVGETLQSPSSWTACGNLQETEPPPCARMMLLSPHLPSTPHTRVQIMSPYNDLTKEGLELVGPKTVKAFMDTINKSWPVKQFKEVRERRGERPRVYSTLPALASLEPPDTPPAGRRLTVLCRASGSPSSSTSEPTTACGSTRSRSSKGGVASAPR
jgi:hypothetical protein